MLLSSNTADRATALIRLDRVAVHFGRQDVLRDINLSDSPRPDAGRHRRERLRQDGAVENDHRPAAAQRRRGLFRRPQPRRRSSEKELTRQRIRFGFLFQQAALFDSMTIAQNVAFPLRQHSDKQPGGDSRGRFGPAGRGGIAGGYFGEEAGRAFRRHAEARGPGPRPGPGARGDALRRADHRARPDHERRDQRIDPRHAAAASGHEHRGHARHAHCAESGRPRGDALSAVAAGGRRAADPLRRPRRSDRAGRPTIACRNSSAARPASGSWRCGNRTGGESWTNV